MEQLNRERMGEVSQPNLARNTLAVLATLVEADNDANRSGVVRATRAKYWRENQSRHNGTYRPKTQAHARK